MAVRVRGPCVGHWVVWGRSLGETAIGSVVVLVHWVVWGRINLVKRPRFEDGFEIQKLPIKKSKQDH